MITINKNCIACGVCVDICPVCALRLTKTGVIINKTICINCGICSKKCPFKAIKNIRNTRNAIIRDIRFQVTKECNFTCPWCFSDAKDKLANELSLAEAIRLTYQLISCGLKTMTLTGGEPLLRKDFCLGLLRYLKKHKIYTKLFTNGSLINERIIKGISGIVNEVQVSVYAQDSWPRVKAIFKQLKKHNIRTVMRVTLTSKNYGQIKELVKLAEESQVDALRVRTFMMQGRGLKNRSYLLNGKSKESIGYLVSVRRDKKYPIQLLAPSFPFLYDKNIDSKVFADYGFIGYTLCKCIEDMGAILPEGTVKFCGYFPHSLGNVRKQNFRKIWSNKNKEKLIVRRLADECMSCIYVTLCGGGCRANAYTNSGSLTAPDPNCPKANASIRD